MWTIAGGILLAILLLIAIGVLIPIALILLAVGLGIALVVAAGYFLINETETTVAIVVAFAVLIFFFWIQAIYRKSRSLKLFLADIGLRLTPAFSVRAKAEKEARWEEHQRSVESHNSVKRSAIINESEDYIAKIATKLWRKYERHGEGHVSRSDQSLSFALSDGTQLFTVTIDLEYPASVKPAFRFRSSGFLYEQKFKNFWQLKGPMKKQIRAAVLEKERALIRESHSEKV